MPSVRTHALLAASSLALLIGCPDEEVTHARVAKEQAALSAPSAPAAPMMAPPAPPPVAAPAADPTPAAPPGMQGEVPMPPKPTGNEALTWTLPQGWTQTLTSGVRYATLVPANAAGVEASVVVLAGPAGGESGNVNRWRGQLGLAPLEASGIDAVRKSIKTPAGTVSLFDFSSEGSTKSRLVAALLVINDSSWFFKMTGDADAVGRALPGFTELVSSLHPGAHAN